MSDVGERVAALGAQVAGLEKYTHQRWHELSNNLQALIRLPEQLARDMGKLDGKFNSEIRAVEKAVERAVTDAVERAVEPLSNEIKKLQDKVDGHDGEIETLKLTHHHWSGGQKLLAWVIQTLITTVSAVAAAVAVATRH